MSSYTGIERIDGRLDKAEVSENRFGNRKRHIFLMDESRYLFDFEMDLSEWSQLDTNQDAFYFGVWVNKGKRRFLSYAEGDLYFTQCKDDESYDRELAHMCLFHPEAPAFTTIDTGGSAVTVTRHYEDRSLLFINPENYKGGESWRAETSTK